MRARLARVLAVALACGAAPFVAAQTPDPSAEALSHFQARRWEEAAAAYADLVRANPYDGAFWENRGFALHQLKRYDESTECFAKASELFFDPSFSLYNLACGKALQGKTGEAMEWLERAVAAGFHDFGAIAQDSDLASLRGEARFTAIVGAQPPDDASREDRWRGDIDLLVQRIEQVHHDPYRKVSREGFAAAAAALTAGAAARSDAGMLAGLVRLLAMIGDGHTGVQNVMNGPVELERYNVGYYLFADGLFVYGAKDDGLSILGGKVLRIGNASAEEALERIKPYCNVDNAMGVRAQAPAWLALPVMLEDAGIIDTPGPVSVTVRLPTGEEKTATLTPAPMSRIRHPAESTPGVTFANAASTTEPPLSMKRMGEVQWFEHLPQLDAVYFKFNGVLNPPGGTFAQSCERLFALIDEKQAGRLIIDVRDNSGGNNTLLRPLLHGLIRRPDLTRRGNFFVITGRRTFSAAMNACVRMERELDPIFVGEPTGSSPNFVGETTIVNLPGTGIDVSISSLYWQDAQPWDKRPWIPPDIVAEPTFEDFAANRDPAMEAVARAIGPIPPK